VNLIVFDIDGTLLNSTDLDDLCYQRALKDTYGISIDEFNWENFKDVTDEGVTEDILETHLGRPPLKNEVKRVEDRMVELVEEKRKSSPELFTPAKNIESVLTELIQQNEIAFCLATGAWHGSAMAKLSIMNVDLSESAFQSATGYRRRADIVNRSIEKAKLIYGAQSFNKVCALGDGEWDMLTAKELDINFIGVDLKNTGRLKELGAELVINGYNDLSQLNDLCF